MTGPVVLELVNCSLLTSVVQRDFKHAVVQYKKYKKSALNPLILASNQPIL